MRLIDAEPLESAIKCILYDLSTNPDNETLFKEYETLLHDVEKMPTVDAVPVVRCKDCIHHVRNAPDGLVYCNVWKGVNGHGLDGFCCYGERAQG